VDERSPLSCMTPYSRRSRYAGLHETAILLGKHLTESGHFVRNFVVLGWVGAQGTCFSATSLRYRNVRTVAALPVETLAAVHHFKIGPLQRLHVLSAKPNLGPLRGGVVVNVGLDGELHRTCGSLDNRSDRHVPGVHQPISQPAEVRRGKLDISNHRVHMVLHSYPQIGQLGTITTRSIVSIIAASWSRR